MSSKTAPSSVLIRAEADARIGLGHVSRCLALAEALEERGLAVVFAARSGGAPPTLVRSGREVVTLPQGEPSSPLDLEDADALGALARARRAVWVVVDHYGAGTPYLERLRRAGVRIALLDDTDPSRAVSADLVVNPNLGACADDYPVGPGALVAAGPRYAPVRRAFRQARERLGPDRSGLLERILVVLGGADTQALTAPLVADLDAVLPRTVRLRVVVGPLARGRSSMDALISPRVDVVGPLDPEGMAAEMADAQAAVATPSTVCWELATLGVAMALVVAAPNQRPAAQALARAGVAQVLRPGESVSLAFVGPGGLCSEAVRRARGAAAAELTDGRGAIRVAGLMLDGRA